MKGSAKLYEKNCLRQFYNLRLCGQSPQPHWAKSVVHNTFFLYFVCVLTLIVAWRLFRYIWKDRETFTANSQPGFAEPTITQASQYGPYEGQYVNDTLVRGRVPSFTGIASNSTLFPTFQDAQQHCDSTDDCVAILKPQPDSHASGVIRIQGVATDGVSVQRYLCPSVTNACPKIPRTDAVTWVRKRSNIKS